MRTILRDFLTPALVLILTGVVAYDHFHDPRGAAPAAVAVDGARLGRAYAPTLAPALADGWDAAAAAIEGGKSVADAQESLQATFKAGRIKQFAEKVAPDFASVLAEGSEPKDAPARAEVAKLWRSFAKGLRGGRS